jgi:hypothetical protein
MKGVPMKVVMAAVVACVLLVPTGGNPDPGQTAGAFGFKKGMTLPEIRKWCALTPQGRGIYGTAQAPKPHPAFGAYVLFVSPKTGLSQVFGISTPIWNTTGNPGKGVDLMIAFTALDVAALQSKYGPREMLDTFSAAPRPEGFMKGLMTREHVLEAVWKKEAGSRLPPGVRTIKLRAMASSEVEGSLQLFYEFENFDAAEFKLDSPDDAL